MNPNTSERSDAGVSILQEVFGFVKERGVGKDGTSCPHLCTL